MRVCDTRWIFRFKNCKSVIDNYAAVIDVLKFEVVEQANKDVAQAIGISNFINVLLLFHTLSNIILY